VRSHCLSVVLIATMPLGAEWNSRQRSNSRPCWTEAAVPIVAVPLTMLHVASFSCEASAKVLFASLARVHWSSLTWSRWSSARQR
jgi:hypothetical protein